MKPSYGGLIFVLTASPAVAQVASIEIEKPRLFGYFIGDVIADDILMTIDRGFVLKLSSLPAPGPLNYWPNLKTIGAAEEKVEGGQKRYHLKLAYQNFYDPLEPHWLKVPGFQLTFDNADRSLSVDVPE